MNKSHFLFMHALTKQGPQKTCRWLCCESLRIL